MSAATPARLRRAVAEDADALALVGRATFLESYAGLLPVTDILAHTAHQHAPERYAQWLAAPDCACWVAEAQPGDAPVGYVLATPTDLPMEGLDARDVEIRRIYLLHRFQGAGRGRALMAAAQEWATQRQCRRLLLGVYSRNEAALAFYARLGFERVGERRFRVGAGEYFDYILGKTL